MSIIPEKLKKNDKVMIIAPSRSLKLIGKDCRKIAEERFKKLGLELGMVLSDRLVAALDAEAASVRAESEENK